MNSVTNASGSLWVHAAIVLNLDCISGKGKVLVEERQNTRKGDKKGDLMGAMILNSFLSCCAASWIGKICLMAAGFPFHSPRYTA